MTDKNDTAAQKALHAWAHGEWTNPHTHCVVESLDCVPEDFHGVVLKIPDPFTDEEPILYRATFGTLQQQS